MNLEIRAASGLSIDGKKIIGRPIVYNSQSENLGGFVEVIAPNAFGDSIQGDIRALVEHDYKMILGRTISNTMRISEDPQGIIVEIDPPNTRTASELIESIERGDISGMSFGFTVNDNGASWDFDSDPALRTVSSAILQEITITSMPAYKATNVEVAKRALEDKEQERAIEYYYNNLDRLKVEIAGY
jgi:HK97 family phage prohead protease